MGRKQDAFKHFDTKILFQRLLRSHIPPAIPLPSSLFPSLLERPTGRIYTKNQTVPFKIKGFPGEIIPCSGQKRGGYQGGNGAKSGFF